jgi:hypothetical protein
LIYLSQESINVDSFILADSVNAKYGLGVIRWVPGGIKNNTAICAYQIDADAA